MVVLLATEVAKVLCGHCWSILGLVFHSTSDVCSMLWLKASAVMEHSLPAIMVGGTMVVHCVRPVQELAVVWPHDSGCPGFVYLPNGQYKPAH